MAAPRFRRGESKARDLQTALRVVREEVAVREWEMANFNLDLDRIAEITLELQHLRLTRDLLQRDFSRVTSK